MATEDTKGPVNRDRKKLWWDNDSGASGRSVSGRGGGSRGGSGRSRSGAELSQVDLGHIHSSIRTAPRFAERSALLSLSPAAMDLFDDWMVR